MTPIAKRSGRAFEVVRRIERRPPIGAVLHEVWTPDLVSDIPLRRENKVVVANLLEVPLLPFTAINKCDVVFLEGDERIGFRQVGQNGFRMFSRIAYDVRHASVFPPRVNLGMARSAGKRPDVFTS